MNAHCTHKHIDTCVRHIRRHHFFLILQQQQQQNVSKYNVIHRDKPLSLYIFTEKSDDRKMFLKQTTCGGVTVNDTLAHIIGIFYIWLVFKVQPRGFIRFSNQPFSSSTIIFNNFSVHFSGNVAIWRCGHEWHGLLSRQTVIWYVFTQEIGSDQEFESDRWILGLVSSTETLEYCQFPSKWNPTFIFTDPVIHHIQSERRPFWCFYWRNARAFRHDISAIWHWLDWVPPQHSSITKW